MTCQHFTYGVDQHCHTMVGCNLRQKQRQQGLLPYSIDESGFRFVWLEASQG